MPKVGDRVTVQITGAPQKGTFLSGDVKVEPGGVIKTGGTLVAEYSDEWEVQLDISFRGKNLIRVPKQVASVTA